uniref:Putative methyl-CpG-binding domain-containing protein 7 isoform X2 n=1 Tax=Davidia involucrata TaxID=16924 RepID=A0A5B7BSW6_DAVIN
MEVDGALSSSMMVPLRLLTPGYYDGESSHHRQLALVPTTASRFQLPDGWVVQEVPRRCDATHIDKYYYEPGSGQKFRSLRDVERYLTGEVYTPRPKALELGNHVKNSGSWKMIISGGKMLRQDEEGSDQLQLAVVAPTITASTSHFRLPDGWIVEAIPRRGTTRRRRSNTDKYYYEPGTGRKFRSLISVERYLAEINENTPLSEAFKLANHLRKSGWQKKNISRQKPKTLTFDSADPPIKVNWVLADPGGDTWSPFMGELMVPDSVKQEWTKRFIFSISDENYDAPNSE